MTANGQTGHLRRSSYRIGGRDADAFSPFRYFNGCPLAFSSSSLSHAGTAEPLRVSSQETVAYLLALVL
jgi:hypothetical protein